MIEHLNVMGIDPGKTVGIATWNGQAPWYSSVIHQRQISRDLALSVIKQWCYESSQKDVPALIGCESFTPRRGRNTVMTVQNDALEIIGAVKVITDQYGIALSMQSPALAKRAMDSKTLKKFRWWTSEISGEHANDAARHIGGALLVNYPEILMNLHEHANRTTEEVIDGTPKLS